MPSVLPSKQKCHVASNDRSRELHGARRERLLLPINKARAEQKRGAELQRLAKAPKHAERQQEPPRRQGSQREQHLRAEHAQQS